MARPHLTSDLSNLLHSIQSFGELSAFLRDGIADEESRELRDSMGALAMHIERVATGRREVVAVAELHARIGALVEVLRQHQWLVTGLGTAWSPIYEYNAYLRAVQQFQDALVQWAHALQRRSPHEKSRFNTFDLVAWRTLGEGMLLLDIYGQGTTAESVQAGAGVPRPAMPLRARWRAWWARLWA